MTATTGARARDIRYVSIEPGRISLHGVSLTDGEYAVLRGIAERMKAAAEHCQCRACAGGFIHASDCSVHNEPAYPNGSCDCGMKDNPAWINEVPTC